MKDRVVVSEMAAGRSEKARSSSELSELDSDIRRTIRRARTRKRRDGGAAWNANIEEAVSLVDRIVHVRANDMAGIAIKLGALRWFVEETEAMLDVTALRQLKSLHRDALKLARIDK